MTTRISYNQFQSKLGGRGLTKKEITDAWHEYKSVGDLAFILKRLDPKKFTKTKKSYTFSTAASDVLLKIADSMNISDILSLCKTNKQFNTFICSKPYFWKQKLEQDFGKYDLSGIKDFKKEYINKYKIMKYQKKYKKPPSTVLYNIEHLAYQLGFMWVSSDESGYLDEFKLKPSDLKAIKNGATVYVLQPQEYRKFTKLDKNTPLGKDEPNKKMIDYFSEYNGDMVTGSGADPWIIYKPGLLKNMKMVMESMQEEDEYSEEEDEDAESDEDAE